MRVMNYFDNMTFEKGEITVVGVNKDADIVKSLEKFLSASGSVAVCENEYDGNADYVLRVPDTDADKRFILHDESARERNRKSGCLIGVLSITVLEKRIGDVVVGAEEFAQHTDLTVDELVYPRAIARVCEELEQFDILYIDDVSNEGRRYLARETAKRHKKTRIRMINTDEPYVERLVELQ